MINKINGKYYNNIKSLSYSLKEYKMNLLEYYIKYENLEVPKCSCGNNCKYRYFSTIPTFRKTCGNKECVSKLSREKTHSEETKEKIRKIRFEYLKLRNGKTAWEKRNKREFSYLENWFIIKGKEFNLFNEYDIIYDYPVYPYFIDFAFINEKVCVEMDGKCHFSNGKNRIEHDFKKDDYLIEKGWKIFRIRFDQVSDDSKIIELINFIGSSKIKNYDNRLYKFIEMKKEKLNKNKIREDKRIEKNKLIIDKIMKSNINFSKYGWVSDVSKIIHINHQKVNCWMKKYMNSFYENECFKRGDKIKNENDKRIKEIKDKIKLQKNIIINSDINFYKFGWQIKLSNLLNLNRSTCIIWMAKYMSDILVKSYSSIDFTEMINYYKNNENLLYNKKQYKMKNKNEKRLM